MKRYLVLLLLLTSCFGDTQHARYVCTCEQRAKIVEFVSSNTKAANNMSDEEMEDVIRELYWTGVRLNCNQRPVWIDVNGNVNYEKTKLDSCESILSYY